MLIEFSNKVAKNIIERAYESGAKMPVFISSQDEYLGKYLHNLEFCTEKVYHFTSNGRFALHDIIIHIANKLEAPEVTITSFNISKEAARQLLRAYNKGIIHNMRFVLNAQKKSNFKAALQIIQGKFDIRFTKIHAKVALIKSENITVSIVSSGNLSNNNNIERGFITANTEVYEFDRRWIEPLFQ